RMATMSGPDIFTRCSCLADAFDDAFLKMIKGTFLLVGYAEATGEVQVAGDRFASIPFYYWIGGRGFAGALNYGSLASLIARESVLKVDAMAVYEFLHLQRVLGDKTYDADSRFLSAATVLSWRPGGAAPKLRRYWTPGPTKDGGSEEGFARALAETLESSADRLSADGARRGLLLSGGLDSRIVLAALPKPATCLTIGPSRNNEVRVAEELARTAKCPHVFLPRPTDHYGRMLEEAVDIGGAMHTFDHAHFLGFGAALRKRAEAVFHGYALDFMFQGKYLPARDVRLLGKHTYLKEPLSVQKDMAAQMADTIPYRLKSLDPLSLLRYDQREAARAGLLQSIRSVLDEGARFLTDQLDLWDYLHMHNLSRHYTYLNLLSLKVSVEERCLAFNNEMLELFYAMPARFRFGARVFKKALGLLDRRFLAIDNANNNMPAGYSPWRQTLVSIGRRSLRKSGLNLSVRVAPRQEDRSWPDRNEMVRYTAPLAARARALADSEVLSALGLFDMDSLRSVIGRHFTQEGNHADVLLSLLTLEEFFKDKIGAPRTAGA
ncbi:MAG: asparagine synthase-related protein, partial [Elusimicrobiota bacterium]